MTNPQKFHQNISEPARVYFYPRARYVSLKGMIRSRKPTVQRLLLLAGIVLFVLGIAITIGVPPIESVPDLPELGDFDAEGLPDRGDLPTTEELLELRDRVVDRVNTVSITQT